MSTDLLCAGADSVASPTLPGDTAVPIRDAWCSHPGRAHLVAASYFAWYLADEPEGYGDTPEVLRQAYRIIRSIDPEHPLVVLTNMLHTSLVLGSQRSRYSGFSGVRESMRSARTPSSRSAAYMKPIAE